MPRQDGLGSSATPSFKPRSCPVCGEPRSLGPRCPTCRVVLSLDHGALVLANTEVDRMQLAVAARRLRAVARSGDSSLDLALIYANLGWLEEAHSQGLAALRLRPHDLKLRAFLNLVDAARGSAGKAEPTPAAPSAPSFEILVIDDSHTVLRAVALMLCPHGYRVRTAATPFEALGMLHESPPNLVFLDLTLPQMDGFKLAKVIRSHEATAKVPIVMLTSRDGLVDRMRSRLIGASGFVAKPFSEAELLDAIRRYGPRP